MAKAATQSTLEGEKAPDMTSQQLKELKKQSAPPKRKRTAKASPAQQTNLQALAQQVQEKLGWDPRITVYLDTPEELKEVQADKRFSRQISGEFQVGGATVSEIGAYRTDGGDRRIVKVVWPEKE
jgi:hypothetical protein